MCLCILVELYTCAQQCWEVLVGGILVDIEEICFAPGWIQDFWKGEGVSNPSRGGLFSTFYMIFFKFPQIEIIWSQRGVQANHMTPPLNPPLFGGDRTAKPLALGSSEAKKIINMYNCVNKTIYNNNLQSVWHS